MKKLFLINTITNFKEIIFDPFAKPFAENNPDIEVYNIMDDTLLKETMAAGGITPSVIRRMYNYTLQAVECGADCVMGTCTSVNAAAKYIRPLAPIPVLNIDEPLAREAVKSGKKLGVMATLPTSPGAIIKLLNESAQEQGREIEIVTKVAEGAFDVLCQGDRAKHDEMVCENLYSLAKEVDAIVFAQISMSLLKHDVVSVPIFKIGESGFAEAKKLILEKK
ncbi:MAG: aspartate/glutamate racemase family protein [Spirochaetales bacterium]